MKNTKPLGIFDKQDWPVILTCAIALACWINGWI